MSILSTVKNWFIGQPQNIGSTEQLLELLDRRFYTSSGQYVTSHVALRAPIVMAIVKLLGEDVAQLPIDIFKESGSKRNKVTKHWLYDLMRHKPNRWQTSFEFREMLMAHLLLRGNFYAYKIIVRDRANGGFKVSELIPLDPDSVSITQNDDYSLSYEITFRSGKQITVSQREMVHIRNTSTDGVYGLTPISLARDSIAYNLELSEYGQEFFGRGAKPSGILQHPGRLSNEARQNLKKGLDSYANDQRASTLVLDEGMTFSSVSMSNSDAEFIDSQRFSNEQIARLYKVPAHKVGIMDKATFSNIEQQALEYLQQSLMPWLKRIEEALYRDLVAPFIDQEFSIEFNVSALLRGDNASRGAFFNMMIANGTLSLNEVRQLEGLNPIPNGEVWARPLNTVYVDKTGKPIEELQPKKPEPAKLPAPEETEEDTDEQETDDDV